MRHGRGTILVATLIVTASCERRTEGAPEEPAEASVELVGSGTVSSELPEFAAAFTPDGDTLFFNRTPPDRSRLDLYYAARTGDGWTEAAPFPATVGIAAIDPFVSLDGARLYFSSDLPRNGTGGTSFNIWYLERTSAGWSEPRDVGAPVNSDASDIFSTFASDGTMVFSSTRDGPRRIYRTSAADGAWTEPEAMTFGNVTEASNPAISRDGSFIVLSIVGPDGSPDLFVSCRSGSAWGEPQPLPAPINSAYTEFAPGYSSEHLYFTSERPGVVGAQPDSVRPPGDIYRTPLSAVRRACEPGG